MNPTPAFPCNHDHVFLSDRQHVHERRTHIVIGLTASMMVVEVVCGMIFGSMALLADGWHMASHASALGITAVAYFFARRHAYNPAFSFGTGKIGELAGFSSALLLAGIAGLMAYASIKRLYAPVTISFDQAIAVALLGLVVNVASAFILSAHSDGHGDHHVHQDHNLRAAYLHVLADALTSVLAALALLAGRLLHWVFMDPLMGIVGAVIISRWSYFLMRDTGRILLDMGPSGRLAEEISRAVADMPGHRVEDLHVWRIGPGHFSAIVSVSAADPNPPAWYKERLGRLDGLSHVTVEVNPLSGEPDLAPPNFP